MQHGAQSARRHFGGVVLPTYVFQYIFKKSRSHAAWGGAASSCVVPKRYVFHYLGSHHFCRFALALCFPMSRGRPLRVFKLYFSMLAKSRPKPFKINGLGDLRKPILGHHTGP